MCLIAFPFAALLHLNKMFGLSIPVFTAILASVTWMLVSSALILLNKDLLSHGFDYPMALSSLGMVFSAAASFLCCKVFKFVGATRTVSPRFYATNVLPVGLLMAITLHFGNLVYLYLTVSFIQMLKALTPIITMLALFVARLETPTRRLVLSVVSIAVGTALASVGEANLSYTGIAIMLASETTEAVRLVMTQVMLVGLKFHPIEGLMYLAPACSFWLLLGSAATEYGRMKESGAVLLVLERPIKFLMAAAMGFTVNILAYIVIQTASSLTLKVLATVKNALVVWIGIVFLHEKVTLLQGVGYAVSVAAFFWYNAIKVQEIGGSAPAGGDAKPSPGAVKYSPAASWERREEGRAQ